MRFLSIIFLACTLVGCSRRSVEVSITNHSSLQIPVIYVCNGHFCQRIVSFKSGATIRVTEPLGESLSLTYWINGHEMEAPIPDTKIRSGIVLLTIGTNYLVGP